MDFDQQVEQLEAVLDEAVVSGDDDELFASGYLRGHFDLVVAQLEMAGNADVDKLIPSLEQAVHDTRHELSPADQTHIKNLLGKLAAKTSRG